MKWIDFWLSRGARLSWSVASGYKVDDKKMRRDALSKLLRTVVDDPSLLAIKDAEGKIFKTYCNIALKRVSKAMGCNVFPVESMANEICDIMDNNTLFLKSSAKEAWEYANNGSLAIAARKYLPHGHVACVFPTQAMFYSGSWGNEVPYVANVGRENRVCPVSQAFPVKEGEPAYYLWQSSTELRK